VFFHATSINVAGTHLIRTFLDVTSVVLNNHNHIPINLNDHLWRLPLVAASLDTSHRLNSAVVKGRLALAMPVRYLYSQHKDSGTVARLTELMTYPHIIKNDIPAFTYPPFDKKIAKYGKFCCHGLVSGGGGQPRAFDRTSFNDKRRYRSVNKGSRYKNNVCTHGYVCWIVGYHYI
jgi:hypothetical protein